jgi:hypothetical protein
MYSLYDNCNHNAKYTRYVRLVCCHSHVCFRPASGKTVAPRSGCSWTALYLRRWRTETHTFHLPCGEMAPTLQDVSYLLGLPIAGEAVGPVAVPPTWRAELQEQFGPVNPPLFVNVPDALGPAKSWVIQFRVSTITF